MSDVIKKEVKDMVLDLRGILSSESGKVGEFYLKDSSKDDVEKTFDALKQLDEIGFFLYKRERECEKMLEVIDKASSCSEAKEIAALENELSDLQIECYNEIANLMNLLSEGVMGKYDYYAACHTKGIENAYYVAYILTHEEAEEISLKPSESRASTKVVTVEEI